MYYFLFLIIIQIVLGIRCHCIGKIVRKKALDENITKHFVLMRTIEYGMAVVCGIGWSYVGIIFSHYIEPLYFAIPWSLFPAFCIYVLIVWPRGVIWYDESGFSMGWNLERAKKYSYSDVTDILSEGKTFAIYVGKCKIQSIEYTKELEDFKACVMKYRTPDGLEYYLGIEKNASKRNKQKTKGNHMLYIAGAIFMMIVGIIGVGFSIWIIGEQIYGYIYWQDLFYLGDLLLLLVLLIPYTMIGIVCIASSRAIINIHFRTCRFQTEGLLVKYPFEKENMISWDQFQQISICYEMPYKKGGNLYRKRTILCFVKQKEKTNFYGHWKINNPFHYRNVICLDYTKELHQEVEAVCQKTIVDLRNTRAYSQGVKAE